MFEPPGCLPNPPPRNRVARDRSPLGGGRPHSFQRDCVGGRGTIRRPIGIGLMRNPVGDHPSCVRNPVGKCRTRTCRSRSGWRLSAAPEASSRRWIVPREFIAKIRSVLRLRKGAKGSRSCWRSLWTNGMTLAHRFFRRGEVCHRVVHYARCVGHRVAPKCASSPVTRCFALRFLWIVERHFCELGLADV